MKKAGVDMFFKYVLDRHPMEKYADELKLLVELDERHDELLRELDELDKQVEAVLTLWLAERDARLEAA